MKKLKYVFIIIIFTFLQGCSTTMYQPLVVSADPSKINSSDLIKKQNIVIKYTGESEKYNKFDIKNYNYIETDGKEELTEMFGASGSSNMPIASNFALIERLSSSFNQVSLYNNNPNKDYKKSYILKYEIKEVDFAVSVYKHDSFFAMPYESGAESTVTIEYELSKNGKNIGKGTTSGSSKDRNTEQEHVALEAGAYKLLSQSASMLALAGSIEADGLSPDPNSKTYQGKAAYQRRINIINDIYKSAPKEYKYPENENKSMSSMTPADAKIFNGLIVDYNGSLQDPPVGLDGTDKGLAWFSPNNYAMRRSLMSSNEKALEKLINKILGDIQLQLSSK